MKMTNLTELKTLLSQPKNIVIIPHRNPDGDAIGSCLGLKHYLDKKGHQSTIWAPNDFPKFLKWMPKVKDIRIAEYESTACKEAIEKADLLFLMDFNSLSRIDELGPWVADSTALTVLIDHHLQPDPFDFMLSNTTVPATCQLVFHFLEQMHEAHMVDLPMAECLYSGILTDTGNFRFRSTGAETFRVASELLSKGLDLQKINSNLFDNNSLERMKLLSLALQQMEYYPEHRTALIWLSREQLKKYGFQKGDTEGFVNYGLGLDNSIFACFMVEDLYKDFIKMSFRSKGEWDVNTFARNHFNGGGHLNAAGGRSDETLEKTKKDFIDLLSKYSDQLNQIII